MGKYWAAVLNSVKKNLAYRANSFIMAFSALFSFGALFYFWNSVYRQGNQVGNYSLSEIISYYIFVAIFEMLVATYVSWDIGDEIKNGQVVSVLTRPLNHLWYRFSQSLGTLLYKIVLFAPIVGLVIFLLKNYLSHPQDNAGYLFFVILALLSFVLNFLIYYIVGILSFWFVDNSGFFFACLVVITFMQGQWIPLDLLPKIFVVLGNYLPFQYLFFVPVGVASGRTAVNIDMIIVPILWCFGLYCLAQILYKKGIKKYEGYGI